MFTTQPAADAQASNRSLLAINSGSSTLKYALFTFAREPQALSRGLLDVPERATAIERLLERIEDQVAAHPLAGVGHRIVHGGPNLRQPQLATPEIVETLRQLVRFAPNHLPDSIALIEDLRRLRRDAPQQLQVALA
jgi:acetate kinase